MSWSGRTVCLRWHISTAKEEHSQLHSLARELLLWSSDHLSDSNRPFWSCDQLFVCFTNPARVRALPKQRVSHWVITKAYSCWGLQSPLGVRAHSTIGIATLWALFRGISVLDICVVDSEVLSPGRYCALPGTHSPWCWS
jgi:hypothetical protein